MKLLLTSAGVNNLSIHEALVELLAQPIAQSSALAIPIAGYGHPHVTPPRAYEFLTGQASTPMCELGWKSVGVLELTALPSNTLPAAERWAAKLDNPAYAVDDDTAFKVVDGRVEVVSEGRWRLLND